MYPIVSERIKAATYDSLILLVTLVIVGQIVSNSEVFSTTSKIIIIGLFFLYDPIATAFFGGTIGHRLVGIRVKRKNDQQKNINFFAALIRFTIKAILGVISLFTVSGRSDRAAIHDVVVQSVVVYA